MTDTLDSLFAEARARFLKAHIGEAALDARVLISGLLDLPAVAFMTRGDEVVSQKDALRIRAAIDRRAAHEPVHRILGEREFYGLMLGMSEHTLEPRPDSEMIVEGLIPFAQKIVAAKKCCQILDLGTGTGAICLALLSAVPEATGVGSDLSPGAVAMAQANAARNTLDQRFSGVESDWFGSIVGKFDIIVSNPPYIRTEVVASLAPEVRDHDPALALDGGVDGLDAYRTIAAHAAGHLADDGIVGVEIGYDQMQVVGELFEGEGFRVIDRVRDLGGNDRAILFSFGR
ncbi:peptide chain release factor N(5)-glutamine methyltransferase [Rhizobium herbae]|uniref:Release factor glutamine methyltransferase n=1 Tax=Rhizobium herbae TaxID=508661 RepID=A0ABS4ELL2_9HYPH|nr:peptide chain release factor N(5)-glutamine methyltransferase [Rhizobium herbae]MBP1858842.1 release factor glutamine methyltransferase [Rhizobium herbae]